MKDILVPVSPGELLDKITILRIKSARMTDAVKLQNVRLELQLLEQTWRESGADESLVADDIAQLQHVNEQLWDIEDQIRDKELAQSFDAEFIELARAVYVTNDERAGFKKRINTALGSRIVAPQARREDGQRC